MKQVIKREGHEIEYDDGVLDFNGKPVMADAKGGWTPLETIKPEEKLEDEMVRRGMAFAIDLSQQIDRFYAHMFAEIIEFNELLAQEYGGAKGGKKGNASFITKDGTMMIKVQVADFIAFGPQLQIAKNLIDECLNEWAADSRPEIRAIVTRAFNTDREGQINKAEIFMLMRLDISEARWQRAMDAIRNAIRVVGSKQYVRFYQRENPQAKWEAVTIDLAKVG